MKAAGLLLGGLALVAANGASAQTAPSPTPTPSVGPPRVPEPGEFRHGDWAGRCYRDGYMAGFTRESCRVTLWMHFTLAIERTAAGVGVTVSGAHCGLSSASETIPAAALVGPGRGARLIATIDRVAAKVMAGCVGDWPSKLAVADAEAFLVESDGLAPVGGRP
ncbi:MAG: hypothetical protein V4574_14760 [Pseudomonadota bacterium]